MLSRSGLEVPFGFFGNGLGGGLGSFFWSPGMLMELRGREGRNSKRTLEDDICRVPMRLICMTAIEKFLNLNLEWWETSVHILVNGARYFPPSMSDMYIA